MSTQRSLKLTMPSSAQEFNDAAIPENLHLLTDICANNSILTAFGFQNLFILINFCQCKFHTKYSIHTMQNIKHPSSEIQIVDFQSEDLLHLRDQF